MSSEAIYLHEVPGGIGVKAQRPFKGHPADIQVDPALEQREKELRDKAKALLSGPKSSEALFVDDWDYLEAILRLDQGWSLMGEAQGKRCVARSKAKGRKESSSFSNREFSLPTDSSASKDTLPRKPLPKETTSNKEEPSSSSTSSSGGPPCSICKSTLPSYPAILQHLQDIHNLFKCPYCTKYITQRSHLYRHIRCVHRDVKNFTDVARGILCQICFQKFPSRELLEEHLKGIHDEIDRFKDKSIAAASQSNTTNTTNNNKMEEKEACIVESSRRGTRKEQGKQREYYDGEVSSPPEDETTETESDESEEDIEDRHRCVICYKSFQSAHHLRRHTTSVHAEIAERVECVYCKKYFASSELLRSHLLRFHKDIQNHDDDGSSSEDEQLLFPCPQCEAKLKSSKELRNHLSRKHGFSNDDKEEEEGSMENVRSELSTNNKKFECHLCHKALKTQKIYRRHLKIVHGMMLKRPVRNVSFKTSMNKNMSSSSGGGSSKRKATCVKCNLVVANKSNLKRHMIRIHGFRSSMSLDEAGKEDGMEGENSGEEESGMEDEEEMEEAMLKDMENDKEEIDVSDMETEDPHIPEVKQSPEGPQLKKTLYASVLSSPQNYSNYKCPLCDIQFNKMHLYKGHVEREHVSSTTPSSSSSSLSNTSSKKEPDFHGFDKGVSGDLLRRKIELIEVLSGMMTEGGDCVVMCS